MLLLWGLGVAQKWCTKSTPVHSGSIRFNRVQYGSIPIKKCGTSHFGDLFGVRIKVRDLLQFIVRIAPETEAPGAPVSPVAAPAKELS